MTFSILRRCVGVATILIICTPVCSLGQALGALEWEPLAGTGSIAGDLTKVGSATNSLVPGDCSHSTPLWPGHFDGSNIYSGGSLTLDGFTWQNGTWDDLMGGSLLGLLNDHYDSFAISGDLQLPFTPIPTGGSIEPSDPGPPNSPGGPVWQQTPAPGASWWTYDGLWVGWVGLELELLPRCFASWRRLSFLVSDAADPDRSGPHAQPQRDGLSNLLKYALCCDPNTAAANPGFRTELANGQVTFSYRRSVERDDVAYEVETSSDLVNWTTDGVVHERVAEEAGMETWQARRPAGGAAVYFRLKVTLL